MNKILIVDNYADLLDCLKFFLEHKNYAVKTLDTADNIYAEVHDFDPDLLIMSLVLSRMDGREICKKLRENIATKYLCVLVFSASPELFGDYKSYGADDFLEKPFDLDTFEKKVKSLVDLALMRKEDFQS
jgi:DNA-binding response OmpR family regulator